MDVGGFGVATGYIISFTTFGRLTQLGLVSCGRIATAFSQLLFVKLLAVRQLPHKTLT